MSEMKQGPWTVIEHSWAETSVMENGERVCLIDIAPYVEDENEQCRWMDKATARARLIAAAPDLLAVIRYAIDNPDFNSDVFDQMARAAIAKAQGHAHE